MLEKCVCPEGQHGRCTMLPVVQLRSGLQRAFLELAINNVMLTHVERKH